MKYCFADIVVVDENQIGVIVKSWIGEKGVTYDVYVRSQNTIYEYPEEEVERYMVRHKHLNAEELGYQRVILDQ